MIWVEPTGEWIRKGKGNNVSEQCRNHNHILPDRKDDSSGNRFYNTYKNHQDYITFAFEPERQDEAARFASSMMTLSSIYEGQNGPSNDELEAETPNLELSYKEVAYSEIWMTQTI